MTTVDTSTTVGPDTAAETYAGELVMLRPEQVAPHPDNIRHTARGIDSLAASIGEVGVLVPLIVVPAASVEGDWPTEVTHIAIDGARRLPAATKAGKLLPCLVRPDLASARETIRTMAVTALAREGLTDREEAHAVQTMLELGLTQGAISRSTGITPQRVRAAKKAASLPETVAQAAQDLTLDQMAALADYADDQQATATLIDAARTGYWDHTLARVRRDTRERAIIAKHIAALQEQGITAVDVDTFSDEQYVEFLRTPDGEPLGDHSTCPGHRVLVQIDGDGRIYEEHYCADPDTYGHARRTSGRGPETVDPEQAAAAREAEKEARRTLIRLNKSALAAQDVRRKFLHESLSAKPRYKTMTAWALARLAQRDTIYTNEVAAWPTTEILRGITGSKDPDREAAAAAPTRHPLLVWATLVAAYEARYPKDAHRSASSDRALYLDHLADLGYQLSETDEIVRTTGHAEAARRAEFKAHYLPAEYPTPEPDDPRAHQGNQAEVPGPAEDDGTATTDDRATAQAA